MSLACSCLSPVSYLSAISSVRLLFSSLPFLPRSVTTFITHNEWQAVVVEYDTNPMSLHAVDRLGEVHTFQMRYSSMVENVHLTYELLLCNCLPPQFLVESLKCFSTQMQQKSTLSFRVIDFHYSENILETVKIFSPPLSCASSITLCIAKYKFDNAAILKLNSDLVSPSFHMGCDTRRQM